MEDIRQGYSSFRGSADRWKVSWGGIFAGAMITLGFFLLLSTLGTALGFTVGDNAPGTGTAIWVGISALFALFAGGWVASQWVGHETKMEALINGAALWSVVFIAVGWLTLNGIQTGFSSIMGLSSLITSATAFSVEDLARLQQQLGLTDQQMSNLQQQLQAQLGNIFSPAQARSAAWWSFFGIVISMLASIGGSLVGTRTNLVVEGARRDFKPRRHEAA